nr:RtcB family protein [Desulfurispira natronophila]
MEQFYSALEQDFVVRGALMPDAHTGYALPIGAVMATRDVVIPAWVGYDIGCGMCGLPTTFNVDRIEQSARDIFRQIYAAVPVGFEHNRHDVPWDYQHLPRSETLDRYFRRKGLRQLGTLGSGNHFIEIACDESRRVWIVIHSGSRNLGHSMATHYMKVASNSKQAREGHYSLSVNSSQGKAYIDDMNFCLEFALANRREMLRRVLQVLQRFDRGEAIWDKLINRNHNHAQQRGQWWIHRKGATHAEKGMAGIIPGNMRDGSFVVEGLGSAEALWSSSHGAGRTMGRNQAKRQLEMKDFKSTMQGVMARVEKSTLDEAPMAYKDIFTVLDYQEDLVQVRHHLKPLVNIKG